MKKWVSAVCVFAGAATAQAGKLESGAAHKPPRVADESDLSLELMHQGKTEGYGFKADGHILNMAEGDRLRLDAMQGAKVVGSAKCRVNYVGAADYSKFECQSEKRDLKMKGPVTFDLVYEDDKTDKEYLARRFNVNVQLWGGETWEITPDDLLGPGYVDANLRNEDPFERRLFFRFWIANRAIDTSGNGPLVFRCKVDGKQVPDWEVESGSQTAAEPLEIDIIKGNKRTTWKWHLFQFNPLGLRVGARDPKDKKKEIPYTVDYPGKWECQLRQQGRALRELAFEMDAKGFPKPHALDAAKGTMPLPRGVTMIDLRIPKTAMIDQRIKPDQLKKSRGFGLAWPDDPAVKAIHAALPAAFENQEPKYVKPKGKRLAGMDHDPPRFVDNSTTEVQVWPNRQDGDFKGYKAKLYAVVSGFTSASDRFRMDWRQGKKVLGTGKCEWSKSSVSEVRCEATGPFKAKGALEADLIYEDDDDGNEYLVRTYAVNVWNPKTFGDPVWLITPDDSLATGWVNIGHREDAELQLHLWFANEKLGEMKLRCTANGKQLPDIKMGDTQTPAALVHEADVRAKQNGPVVEYFWYHLYSPTTILTGPKDKSATLQQKDKVMWLADNPGQWDCMVRSDGKPVRQLLFTVNKDGYVEADPAQVDPKFPFLGKNVPIDVRFVKDSKLDTRIKGDAMKKSRGFGLPWPKAPTKPFPATSGLPDPK